MALTIIKNKPITPDYLVKNPKKCKGGYFFNCPPTKLWRYNVAARKQVIEEWCKYGFLALASIIGGGSAPMGTMVSAGPFPVPVPSLSSASVPAFSNVTNDAAGEFTALVFRVPKTGLIRGFGHLILTATGSPTADFQLESVDLGTGFPSGTPIATDTVKTGVTVTTGWFDSGDFTADYNATVGTLAAAVMRYASGTTIVSRQVDGFRSQFPYCVTNTGSSAKVTSLVSTIAIRYSDGTYAFIPGTVPASAINSTAFQSGSATNHRGAVWTPAFDARVYGGWIYTNNNADYDFIVATDNWDGTADNDGSSNIVTSIDKDAMGSTGPGYILFNQSLTLAAGSDYRAICKPTTGTNVTVIDFQVSSSAIMGQFEQGVALRHTTAGNPTGSGDWTNSNLKRFYGGFLVDQVDDGTGSGGGGGGTVAARGVQRGNNVFMSHS